MKARTEFLKDFDIKNANEKIKELRAELIKERAFIKSRTKTQNPAKLKTIRRRIALINTMLNKPAEVEVKKIKKAAATKTVKKDEPKTEKKAAEKKTEPKKIALSKTFMAKAKESAK